MTVKHPETGHYVPFMKLGLPKKVIRRLRVYCSLIKSKKTTALGCHQRIDTKSYRINDMAIAMFLMAMVSQKADPAGVVEHLVLS